MSVDTTPALGLFQDWYRVGIFYAIENIQYDEYMFQYFKDSILYDSFNEAYIALSDMMKEYWLENIEYDVHFFRSNICIKDENKVS